MPSIRQAHASDAQAIGQLVRSLVHDSLVDPGGEEALRFYATLEPAEVARYMAMPHRVYTVAEAAGEIVGMILLRDHNYVGQFFVARAHQRKGVGAALWHFAMSRAREYGGNGEFSVNSSLAAQPVYEKFGFHTVGPPQVQHGFKFVPMCRAATSAA